MEARLWLDRFPKLIGWGRLANAALSDGRFPGSVTDFRSATACSQGCIKLDAGRARKVGVLGRSARPRPDTDASARRPYPSGFGRVLEASLPSTCESARRLSAGDFLLALGMLVVYTLDCLLKGLWLYHQCWL